MKDSDDWTCFGLALMAILIGAIGLHGCGGRNHRAFEMSDDAYDSAHPEPQTLEGIQEQYRQERIADGSPYETP